MNSSITVLLLCTKYCALYYESDTATIATLYGLQKRKNKRTELDNMRANNNIL
jgi:hypothetical protein